MAADARRHGLLLAALLGATAFGQSAGEGWRRGDRRHDGRFTFVRLRWGADFSTGRRVFGFGSSA